MTYQKKNLVELTRRVYRLTLLFPKKEPLRYKIREVADDILTQFILSRHGNPVKIGMRDLLLNLEILDSFWEVAKEQNWVSPSEISEVQNEYRKLLSEFEKENKEIKSPQVGQVTVKPDIIPTPTELNERQKKILEILKEKEKIQVWQLKEIFPQVSKRTLRRDFQSLYKRGIIERIGERTNTFYKLK